MSCDVAMVAYLLFASAGAHPAGPPATPLEVSVAREPLFADIIHRAGRLKSRVESYRAAGSVKASPRAVALPAFDRFQTDVGDLAALDMQGHLQLAQRGVDGDLKCILKGISQDLGVKLHDLGQAATGAAQDQALRDMAYLLNDNVEVITAPPAPPA